MARKIPALPLALFCEQRWLAPQQPADDAMRSGGHRPAGRAGGSQPAGATGALPGQQPPTAAVRPRFPSLPLQPAATPRPHHSTARAPGLRGQPSLLIAFPPAGGWGRSSSPQPPGRGEAAPLPPRAPHAGAGPLPTEQHALHPGPRGRGVRGGREEEEET